MPYFDENPLQNLAFAPDEADQVLDLAGIPTEAALQRVERLLQDEAQKGSYLIRFDAAGGDGRETLFLPLGRLLLQARRDGHLDRCLPASDGAAYFISFRAPR